MIRAETQTDLIRVDDGEGGVSPSAEITQTATGATITITDASGTTTADIDNGADGVDIIAVTPYYYAQLSTVVTPPTFDASTISNWSTAQPAFDTTKDCYIAFLTEFSNSTFDYGEVSKYSEYEASKTAYSLANAAKGIAENTSQYFWLSSGGSDNGAHITQVDKNTFISNPSGGNTLITSNGVAIRDGLIDLATFGANGAQIGTNDESNVKIASDSIKIRCCDEWGIYRGGATFSGEKVSIGRTHGQHFDLYMYGGASERYLRYTSPNGAPAFGIYAVSDGTETTEETEIYVEINELYHKESQPFSVTHFIDRSDIVTNSYIYFNVTSHFEGTTNWVGALFNFQYGHENTIVNQTNKLSVHYNGGTTFFDTEFTITPIDETIDYIKIDGAEITVNAILQECCIGHNLTYDQNSGGQLIIGKHNGSPYSKSFVIGNGTNDDNRSNALTVDWSGVVDASRYDGKNGSVNLDNTSIPTSNIYTSLVRGLDSNNKATSYLQSLKYDNKQTVSANNGAVGTRIMARRTINGGDVYNAFAVIVRNDGSLHYSISSPANFRSDLNLQTLLTSTSPTVSVTNTTGTLTAISARRYGNIVQLSLTFKSSSSCGSGANFYKGTINQAALHPLMVATAGSYYGAHAIGATLSSDGVIVIRNASDSAVTPSSGLNISFTYVVAS